MTSSSGIMSSPYAVDDILFKNALAALPAKLLESMQKAGLTDPGILRRFPRYSSDELMIVSLPVSPSTGQASSGVESATVAVVATKAAGFVDQSSAVEPKDAVQNIVIDSLKDSAETAVTDARAVPMVPNIVRDYPEPSESAVTQTVMNFREVQTGPARPPPHMRAWKTGSTQPSPMTTPSTTETSKFQKIQMAARSRRDEGCSSKPHTSHQKPSFVVTRRTAARRHTRHDSTPMVVTSALTFPCSLSLIGA